MQIYLSRNNINNKKYIGADSKDDPNYFGSGMAIRNALKKYGKENFSKIILEHCESEFEMYEREIYWIEKYNAEHSDEFYNMSPGGKGGNKLNNPIVLKKWKENTPSLSEFNKKRKGLSYEDFYGDNAEIEKRKRSESLKGKKFSKERCDKISESLKGREVWNKGLCKENSQSIKKQINSRRSGKGWKHFKTYFLTTPNNGIIEFDGKKCLEEYFKYVNNELPLRSRITVDKLIKLGELKQFKIKIIKNGREFK